MIKDGIATGIAWENLWDSFFTVVWLDDGDAKCESININEPFTEETLERIRNGELNVGLQPA